MSYRAAVRPDDDLEACAAAHRRLLASLETLTDDEVGQDSRCEGWTIGHVLTHLARNADSHVRMVDGARRGEVVSQYEPGARERDIEAGARRSARALVDDLRGAIERAEAAWRDVPDDVWASGAARTGSGVVPIAEMPFRRWREVEVHHADLGRDLSYDDFTPAYVAREEREPEGRRYGGRTF
jgi:maleylpyruvate isomerase